MEKINYSMFSKPWPKLTAGELAKLAGDLGFDGIELPVRPGYQVEPQDAEIGLPQMAQQLSERNIKITSIAGNLSEQVFAGCQAAHIPLIRIMAGFDGTRHYLEKEADMRRVLENALPLCEKYGITIGVQNHYGNGVFSSMELRHLLENFDKRQVGAIWDAAHSGLAGEDAAKGLSILWDYICLINLKSAYYKLVSGPEAEQALFKPYFTTARHGNIDWKTAIAFCRENGYQGTICFPAEYTDEKNVLTYIASDVIYAKSLVKTIYHEA